MRILALRVAAGPVSSRIVSNPLPLHFRTAVILGCIALLIGVAGIFVFQRADETDEQTNPEGVCTVAVHGLDSSAGIRLRASWLDLDGKEHEESGKPTSEALHWVFHRAPSDAPVTLEVLQHAGGTRRVLHATPALLTRGGVFEVWIPDGR